MKLSQVLLQQFDAPIATQLIEFGKHISKLDVDCVMFMARKSICLYEMLLRLGVPPFEQVVVSDRVLDMSLRPFTGKRIALVDDTLIVGTTLAKTKQILTESAKATVSVHVFCVDTAYRVPELIEPDTVGIEADDQRTMTLCSSIVRALSLLPRPYVVDFPISLGVRVRKADMQCLLSSVDWTSHRITTELQRRNDVETYTFFPNANIKNQIDECFGSLAPCLQITKVRAFGRRINNTYWFRFVPFVTLAPMHFADADAVFEQLIDVLEENGHTDLKNLTEAAVTTLSRQRLVQYILSAALGRRFAASLSKSIAAVNTFEYDKQETDWHFGPWLHNEMSTVLDASYEALMVKNCWKQKSSESVQPASIPPGIENTCREVFGRYPYRLKRSTTGVIDDLLPDFVQIFLSLYDCRELPARKEARELGKHVISASGDVAPYRDRLEIGLPWTSILTHMASRYRTVPDSRFIQVLSLALDECNDLGVSVPITCQRDGVVFRAYRHGEDVHFTDSELALAFNTVQGLKDATGREGIPHLLLEKALVLLIRLGAAMGYLEPLFGIGGADGTVRIGFYLKGAVPLFSQGPRDRADRDLWLSDYLVRRGVLRKKKKSDLYQLGIAPEGNFLVARAPDEAYDLGVIIGSCYKWAKKRDAPLDDSSLIVLATCIGPRSVAAALQVELDVFTRWYSEVGRFKIHTLINQKKELAKSDKSTRLKSEDSLTSLVRAITQSEAHEAVHSARLKYVAYKRKTMKQLISECGTYLSNLTFYNGLARRWSSYWKTLDGLTVKGEESIFDPLIANAMSICWELFACLSLIEISLHARVAQIRGTDDSAEFRYAIGKFNRYNRELGELLPIPSPIRKLQERVDRIEAERVTSFDHGTALNYALDIIDGRLPQAASLIEQMDPLIRRYGKLSGLHEYKYMLYFDVKDSTATRKAATGGDVEPQRQAASQYIDLVNRQLMHLSSRARKQNCEIFCWNGVVSSTNDAKHIFLSGEFAKRYLSEVVHALTAGTRVDDDIKIRIYIVPCNFANSSVYRYPEHTEVTGKRFWEHWSRLQKHATEIEKEYVGESFLLIATEGFERGFSLPDDLSWNQRQEKLVTTEIEGLFKSTRVYFGAIGVSSPQAMAAGQGS